MSIKKEDLYFFIQKPRFAVVIAVLITFIGLLGLFSLQQEKYPNITPPQVTVNATYPGASASVIESSVASLLETQINGVSKMLYMTSTCYDGKYTLNIFFETGSDNDINLMNVQNKLQQIQSMLPKDVVDQGIITENQVSGAGAIILSLASEDESWTQLDLTNYASIYVKDAIKRIKGVGEVNVFGADDYSMRIWLKPDKLANLNVTVSEVRTAIKNQNIQLSTGSLGDRPTDNPSSLKLSVMTKGRLSTPEEFENIIIRSNSDGSNIKLKEVADVKLGAKSYTNFGLVNAKPGALIQVMPLPGANTVNIVENVYKEINKVSKTLPDSLTIKPMMDSSIFITESMNEVKFTILLTSALVILIIFVFLGDFKATLIPCVTIPVSLVGTFMALKLLGMSLNLLTLFALILAVAVVVDDAIVVIENVKRHMEDGKNAVEATQITMKEVGSSLIAMASVLMAVFVPMCFMTGLSGTMYKQFAVCIAVSIALSAICALSLSPAMCSILLEESKNNTKQMNKYIALIVGKIGEYIKVFNVYFDKLTDYYMLLVKKFVYNKKLTVMFYVIMLGFMVIMFKVVPTGFIPDEDQGMLIGQILLPDGASTDRTVEASTKFTNAVRDIEGIDMDRMIIFGGSGPANQATAVISLTEWGERKVGPIDFVIRLCTGKATDLSHKAILKKIRQRAATINEASIQVFSPPAIDGLSLMGGFEYQLVSLANATEQELSAFANDFINKANNEPTLTNVYTTFQANVPQYRLTIDYEKAMAQGIDLDELNSTLASTISYSYVNDFTKLGRVYRVFMQADSDFRNKMEDLEKIKIISKTGKIVPITTVVNLKQVTGAAAITRYNLFRAVQVQGQNAPGKSSGEAMNAMAKLSENTFPREYTFDWTGTSLQERQSSGQTFVVIALALFFVYMFLVALYESYMMPVAVLLVSPVAIIGALLFQLMMGQSLDLYAQVGMITLIGLAAKQSILIVEFARKEYEENGLPLEEATLKASLLRFRAIMMTEAAFVLGILPLLFASGAGANSRISVGCTVMGGMIAAATLGTIMTPAFYVIVQDFVDKHFNNKNKGNNENEN